MNTIIEVNHKNYEERIIVNSKNALQAKKVIGTKEWEVIQQGDYYFEYKVETYSMCTLKRNGEYNGINRIESFELKENNDGFYSYRLLTNNRFKKSYFNDFGEYINIEGKRLYFDEKIKTY